MGATGDDLASVDEVPPARPLPQFPVYTRGEERLDRLVHVVGLVGVAVLAPWLLARLGPAATARQTASIAIYLFGLVAMLAASAAYNLTPRGARKARLRQIDRSMIFVMIAGSYTPFALIAMPSPSGTLLCSLVWAAAVAGIALEFGPGSRLNYNLTLTLYLAMGWLVLAFARPLVGALSTAELVLLFAGGVLYTVGALLHAHGRLLFHNAAWHTLVAAAATLHYAAVASLLPRPV